MQNLWRRLTTRLILVGLLTVAWLDVSSQTRRNPSSYFTIVEPIAGSDLPLHLSFVLTKDFIHTPIALRKPKGEGPFRAVLFLSGNGSGGMARARWAMLNAGYTMNRFLEAGYVVAYLRYRGEVPLAYRRVEKLEVERNIMDRSPLDHDDVVSAIEYVKRLPYVDANQVGMVGLSHGGELIMKVLSEIDIGAAVCHEPAAHEFLGLAMDKLPPGEPQLQYEKLARELADKEEAMSRINRINTPLLIVGRDEDHLQGLFHLSYRWLKEAGKDAQWISFDHPRHGFLLPRRNPQGKYEPDEIQLEAIDFVIAYFDQKLRP
ncbi:MAG: dienelactone hydrolase family protein [Verrucomicrobia bacterium]|nr:dienelactone hydrolase family protein [Verrucomicrobiota bacterium]